MVKAVAFSNNADLDWAANLVCTYVTTVLEELTSLAVQAIHVDMAYPAILLNTSVTTNLEDLESLAVS